MVRVCAITLAVAAVTVASMADDRADDGFIEVDGTTRNLVIQPPSDGAVDVRGNVTISG
eukprot:gene30716-26700_t